MPEAHAAGRIAALRDLQWRRRRFLIAVLGTALVLSMTLVLAGLSAAFVNEVDRTMTARARTASVVAGYSVRDFRQRIGPQGMGDLLSHAGDATIAAE